MTKTEADPRFDAVWTALSMVIDPEVGLDIVTMGLVYDVSIENDVVHVTHTLTTPRCPLEPIITAGIRESVGFVRGIDGVKTHLVWDPSWHPGMIQMDA